ncbi:MAG: aminotransferase class IV, partial [Thermoplasmata archaeon]
GKLYTPPIESDILIGITRDSIIKVAEYFGIKTIERNLHREELYIADEVFFVGTAAEITPIVNIDAILVGNGNVGPITSKLYQEYQNVVHGRNKDFSKWLTPV